MLLAFLTCGIASGEVEATKPPHMYVPDGQLKGDWFEVFITEEITEKMTPQLYIYPATGAAERDWTNSPMFTGNPYPHQQWQEQRDGKPISFEGTLILFNLSDYRIPPFKSAVRSTPSLVWYPTGTNDEYRWAIYSNAVYIGDKLHALLLTAIVVMISLLIIGFWARAKSTRRLARMLISGPDGYLSLWRTQLAAWTVAIGSMVFFFGIVRLRVPELPDSLVALMGMSLLTGGLSSAKSHSDAAVRTAKKQPPVAENPGRPALPDLIGDYDEGTGRVLLSLQKAQMAFWTILMLLLFVGKTVAEGQLWEVPWQLVALTGFSQAGYIGDKFAKGSP